MKLLLRILKRNHQLYQKWKLQERLVLCLIREEDNAFQRNKKAVEYIDDELINFKDYYGTRIEVKKILKILHELREILTTFKTDNVLNEVNKEVEE